MAAPLREVDASHASYRDREGVEVIGRVLPIVGYPWFFLSEQPVQQALGPLRALRRTSLYLAALLALLVVASAWLVSAGIVAPIQRLASAAGRLGTGDLSARVWSRGSDEIGDLGRAFNDMAGELESASLRVQELHEREIERAQQLATVGELASGLTHEIKNAIVAMSNGLDLLGRRVRDQQSTALIIKELARPLAQIERAVKSLLMFARPPEPTRTLTDANRIADSAVHLIRPSAVKQGLQVHFDPHSEQPTVLADAEMIRQALVNLLVNAIQATPEGGQIRLSTTTHADKVLFSIRDTGRGIPADQQDAIFRPFFTTRNTGTGLGLSITRKIVQQHGGQIRVESEVGVGTTFTITIPTDSTVPADDPSPSAGDVADEE